MAQGSWTQTFPSISEHTKAKGAQVNSRVDGLGSNYDMLPAPHDDGKKGFFEPCYVGDASELGHAPNVTDIRNSAITHGIDSGAVNAYVVTMSIASLAYVSGMKISFVVTNTNTGSSTVNVDGLGVVSLKSSAVDELPDGYIFEDDIVEMIYTGTFFQITSVTSHVSNAAASASAASASASAASASEIAASASETVCLASSNYIGEWDDQSGDHVVPTSVYHDSEYWMLIQDITNITTQEPGSAPLYWVVINTAQVDSVVGTTDEIDIDATDPKNPIVSISPNFSISINPPTGSLLEGDIIGGNASMVIGNITEDTIAFTACKCYDSTGTVLLESVAQDVIMPSTGSTVQNFFLCDDGVIRTDTDVGGASLLAGSVTHLRWLFFNHAMSSGYVKQFMAYGDRILFLDSDGYWFGTVNTTWNTFDHSLLMPVERIAEIWYGFGGTDTAIVSARDGQLGWNGGTQRITGYLGGGPTNYDWNNNTRSQPGHIVFSPDREFKTSSGTIGMHVHGLRLKR